MTGGGTSTAEWWDATHDRRFLLQRCSRCGATQHHPRHVCTSCGGTDLGYVEASGAGVVHSWTEVHRAPDPAFDAPYVVALVRLAEGPTLLTRIVDVTAADLVCDLPVTLDWTPLPDGRQLPVFRPA